MERCINVNEVYKADPKLRKEHVQIILHWTEKQAHLPEVYELQAALALHSCFYSIEAAKTCLETFFTIRTECPEIFANSNPEKNPLIKQAMNTTFLSILPQKTPEGYSIILTKLMDTNPDVYNPTAGSKVFDMITLLDAHLHGPSSGIVVIMDMKGGVFGHLTKLNLSDFKKFMIYVQTAMPIRLKTIHFINVVPFMDKLMAIIRPFINKELFEKLVIHTNNENLYKYFPKDYMPSDYGGKCEPVSILYEKFKKSIFDNKSFFEFQESQIVDENKRTGSGKNADNLFGFDGTFKKLEFD